MNRLQLGSKFGTWLLERQLTPKYGYMGTTKEGSGGLWEQVYHQGLDPQCEWNCQPQFGLGRPVVTAADVEGLFYSDHPQDQAALAVGGRGSFVRLVGRVLRVYDTRRRQKKRFVGKKCTRCVLPLC